MKRKERDHRLFIGPFQPDLEEGFLAFLKKMKEGDPLAPVAVMVGSNLLGVYLRRFLGREQVAANVRKVLDQARAFEGERQATFRRFVE